MLFYDIIFSSSFRLSPLYSTAVVISLNVSSGQQVIIDGTVTLPPGAITIVYSGNPSSAPIIVTGYVDVSGPIYVIITGNVNNGDVIPVLEGLGNITGNFSQVVVTGGRQSKCKSVSGTVQDTGSIGVLVSVSDTCSKRALSPCAFSSHLLGYNVNFHVMIIVSIIIIIVIAIAID